VFVLLFFLSRWWRDRVRTQRERDYAAVRLASVNASLYAKGQAWQQLPPHSQLLCVGFKRAQLYNPTKRKNQKRSQIDSSSFDLTTTTTTTTPTTQPAFPAPLQQQQLPRMLIEFNELSIVIPSTKRTQPPMTKLLQSIDIPIPDERKQTMSVTVKDNSGEKMRVSQRIVVGVYLC
jgi:hypothetical protein